MTDTILAACRQAAYLLGLEDGRDGCQRRTTSDVVVTVTGRADVDLADDLGNAYAFGLEVGQELAAR